MSGRPKIKVYEYDVEGHYLRDYDNINEVRRHYYPDDLGARPIFVKQELGFEYHITALDTILFKERPGRDIAKFIIKIHNSEYCNILNTGLPIEMVSIKEEVLATFPNITTAAVILPGLSHKIYRDPLLKKRTKKFGRHDFYFRFKK